MHTLILSCNTGQGHNSCARAISEVFEAHGSPCEIADSLLFISEAASHFISSWHVRMYRYLPKLYKSSYKGVESHASPFKEDSPIYQYLCSGAERMYEYILHGGFDCVICTHVFPAIALTNMLAHHPVGIKTAFVATDYTCSPGAADSSLAHYFIPDASLVDEFAACGVDPARIIPSGLPVRREFYLPGDAAQAKRRIGVAEGHRHMLLMCGSMGCGPMYALAVELSARLSPAEELTIICGSNARLYDKLGRELFALPNIHIEAAVDDMPLYMRASELYLTKPGGLSTSEAAAMGLPMVLIDTVAGCEAHNLDFFVKKGGAVTADTPQELADIAVALLRDDARRAGMSRALRPSASLLPAECIYETMIARAAEA